MSQARQARAVEAVGVILFFIQALRVVMTALFATLYDHGFEGALDAWSVAAVGLVAVAFLAPLIPTGKHAPPGLMVAALVATMARPILNVNELVPRYWAGLAVLAAGGVYLVALIRSAPGALVPSLVAALVIDQVLRAWGNTCDLSIRPEFLAIQIALSLALAALSIGQFAARTPQPPTPSGKMRAIGGLAMGTGLFVITSLLTLPNAVARWSDFEYAAIAPALVALTCAPFLPQFRDWAQRLQAGRKAALMAAALIGLAVGYQRWGIWSAMGLLTAYTVLLVSLTQIVELDDARPDRTGVWLSLGLVLLLALNIALGFAFTYPYTVRWMQGMGLPLYLIAGLLAILPSLFRPAPSPLPSLGEEKRNGGAARAFTLLTTVIVLVAAFPVGANVRSDDGNITAATYTIRYGFDNRWRYALEDIARAIEESGADIVTLQEADTGRMTSLCADDVFYLARRLRMNSYYLPTVERLTGIAVLSRLPIVQTDARFLTSQQEQTGIIHAQLAVAGRDLHFYGTWLGVRGENTQRQTSEAIAFIGGNSPTVLGGAFNTEQGSSVYAAINEAGFDFAAFGLSAVSPHVQARDPAPHTNYVWLRGLTPLRGWSTNTPPTNHKMVAVRFSLP